MNKSRSWGRMIPHFSTHPNHKKDDEICLLRPFHSIKMMILIPIWPIRLSIIVSNMGIIYQIYQIWAYSNPYNLYLNTYCIYIYYSRIIRISSPSIGDSATDWHPGPHLCRSWPSLLWSMRSRRPGKRVA